MDEAHNAARMVRVLVVATLLTAVLAAGARAQVWLPDTAGPVQSIVAQAQLSPPLRGPLGAGGCAPPSPARRWAPSQSIVESRATGIGVETWALIFDGAWASTEAAVFTGVATDAPFKIAWRLTGSGPLHLTATAPDGAKSGSSSGPTPHGSNWRRPGDEWGSTFLLGQEGCWQIRASRDDGFADLWIVVSI